MTNKAEVTPGLLPLYKRMTLFFGIFARPSLTCHEFSTRHGVIHSLILIFFKRNIRLENKLLIVFGA